MNWNGLAGNCFWSDSHREKQAGGNEVIDMKMKMMKIVVVSLFIYAMVILVWQVLNSDLSQGWQWVWTLVFASVAAGGALWLFTELWDDR